MVLDGFSNASDILRTGVYALVYRKQVVYVGKSKGMLTRIYTHKSLWSSRRGKHKLNFIPIKGILFDECHIRVCTLEEIDRVEQEMIRLYKPKFNIKHNPEPVRHLGPVCLVINGRSIVIGGTPPKFERRV